MDTRPRTEPAVIARLPLGSRERAGEPSVQDRALQLAGAHAYAGGADGVLRFTDPGALERTLFARPGTLQTTRAAWEARICPADRRARARALAALSWPGARMSVDYAFTDAQGATRHLRETAEALEVAEGRAARISGVVIDRTDAVAERERSVWAARHDAVTGLENRACLVERGAVLAALGTRAQLPATLLRLRVTNHAELASVYGNESADRLLSQLARRLEDAVRLPDALARLGDQDFGLCLLGGAAGALQARLRDACAEAPYNTPFGPLYLDLDFASARVSPLPGGVETALDATRRTLDGEGAGPARSSGPAERIDVITALEDDRISLAFQPIVSARDGQIHHHECLLRLRQDDGRMVSAGAIVQDAERLGLISRLDERALELAAPHLAKHADVHLALNVSAGTLGDAATARRYIDRLAALGDATRRITVEMTETLAVDDPAAAARFSSDVRALGCRFAIDDFGSGYTTFRNLMAVEADCIKIDGQLIRGIATDQNKQTFMRMMVDLAQTFSVKTVAEMVETEADAAMLRRLGADYLQGYHFGHPAPAPVWSRLAG